MSKVAVIGGGMSGLTSAKSCAEQGLLPTVFEKSGNFGGVWRLNGGNAWSNMQLNGSKFTTTFADYPWPETSSLHPTKEQVNEYIKSYMTHFNLDKFIKYNSSVTYITQLDNKKWLLKWENTLNKESHEEVFDFLIISSGIYTDPYIPKFENLNGYKGLAIHSISYDSFKSSQDVKGKHVVVVGHGFSAVEICAELAHNGANVVNIFSKPHWVVSKFARIDQTVGGLPVDFHFFNRKANEMFKQIKHDQGEKAVNMAKNKLMSQMCAEQNKIPELYIDPDSSEIPYISISSDYINEVKKGLIKLCKSHIKSFTDHGVIMQDDSFHHADIVIFCTGYSLKINFVDPKILSKMEHDENESFQPLILYKGTFHLDIENFACVGMIREPTIIHTDLQARWVSLVFTNKLKLPDRNEFDAGMEVSRKHRREKEQAPAEFVIFPEDIASIIGVLPNLDELKATDPEAYEIIWDGPLSGVEYRLKDNKEQSRKVLMEIAKHKENLLKKV